MLTPRSNHWRIHPTEGAAHHQPQRLNSLTVKSLWACWASKTVVRRAMSFLLLYPPTRRASIPCEAALGLLGKQGSRSNGVRHSRSFTHQPAALLYPVKPLWDWWASKAVGRMAFAILAPLPTNPPRFTRAEPLCGWCPNAFATVEVRRGFILHCSLRHSCTNPRVWWLCSG
jgi:hypothetical protein